MKFNKKHLFVMLALDLIFLIFLGPALISATSWIAVFVGFIVAAVLAFLTYKVVENLLDPPKGDPKF